MNVPDMCMLNWCALSCEQVPAYLNAGARQFGFMLRGLKLMQPKLEALNIPFFLVKGDPVQTVPELVEKTGASLLVTDFASLRLGRQWRDQASNCSFVGFQGCTIC